MKLADTVIIIKGTPPTDMPPLGECPLGDIAGDMGDLRLREPSEPVDESSFISQEDLKSLGRDGKKPEYELDTEDEDEDLPEVPEEKLKEACAFQMGMQFAWKEAGINDDLRRHLLCKTALALQQGRLKKASDYRSHQLELEKEARYILEDQVKHAVEVDPTTHLLLMALTGGVVGGTGGLLVDKIKEKLTGKKSKRSLALMGLLTGAGAGAAKHLYDLNSEAG